MAKKVKVEGEVVLRDGAGVEMGFFEETFILSDAVENEAQARSMIQAGLISERLRKNGNYKHWRTCQVVEFETVADKPDNGGELDALLLQATQLGCVPDNIDAYKRPDYKLKALQKAIDNAKSRKADKSDDLEVVD